MSINHPLWVLVESGADIYINRARKPGPTPSEVSINSLLGVIRGLQKPPDLEGPGRHRRMMGCPKNHRTNGGSW